MTPAAYSTFEAEYSAITEAAGLADLSGWNRIRFLGSDCRKFLHGLLTSDVLNLKPLRGCHGCILTPKGKLLADFDLYDRGDDFLALCPPAAGENLKSEISKKIVLSDSRMEDVGGSTGLFYLVGPKSRAVLERLFGPMRGLDRYELARPRVGEARVEIASSPRLAPDGVWLMGDAGRMRALWADLTAAGDGAAAGGPQGLSPVGWDALNAVRIERGIPLYGVDMDEGTIPLEARLEDAISFTKGCYMGQETIARVKNLGHVNRTLAVLRVERADVPPAGAEILFEDKEIGRVTSAARSPRYGAVAALGMVRIEHGRPGSELTISWPGKRASASVLGEDQ